MEADPGQVGVANDSSKELADRFGEKRFSFGVGEYRVSWRGWVSVVVLALLPFLKHSFGVGVEVDAAAAGAGLGGEFG